MSIGRNAVSIWFEVKCLPFLRKNSPDIHDISLKCGHKWEAGYKGV